MSQADAPAADWYPDPSGRFQFRYWDGESWTGHVSTDGKTDWDPPGDAAPEAAQELVTSDPAAQEHMPEEAEPEPASAGGAEAEVAAIEIAEAEHVEAAQGMAAVGTATDDPWAPMAQSAGQSVQGGTIEEGEPSDTNLVANQRAGLDDDVEAWLNEVAGQVEARLSRIEASWTSQPQAEAARACAYGLLVGHLAHLHPQMRSELSLVAESHPSFTTLEVGARLDTLEQIARDPQRTAAWLGPLIGTEDVDRVKLLFD